MLIRVMFMSLCLLPGSAIAGASDLERTVVAQVVDALSMSVEGRALTGRARIAPDSVAGQAVFASHTLGGAEAAALRITASQLPASAAEELSHAYLAQNRERHLLDTLPIGVAIEYNLSPDVPPDSDVWSAIELANPDARTFVILSRPVFDHAEQIAMVRADVFVRDYDHASTKFFLLTRQSDGTWTERAVSDGYPRMRSSD